MTHKNEPVFGDCLICDDYTLLPYKDLTIGARGFCHCCVRHVIDADYLLNKCGLKDPPRSITDSPLHRIA